MTGTLRVGVVGTGYVGLTTAVCLAERGHHTVAVDLDHAKVRRLRAGESAIDEPDLPMLLRDGISRGRLVFGTEYAGLADRDLVFVCVPTPSAPDGQADLSFVESAVDRLAAVLGPGAVLAIKSTVPVGTSARLGQRVRRNGVRVVSTPEFLREGRAVHDFRHPDRVVIGTRDASVARTLVRALGETAPVLQMSPESAELAKYASNAFLAVKLSYTNSLATLCGRVGADIRDVTRCMGADGRIGPEFLRPGPGWGGSCLPKDTAALVHTAHRHGVVLREVEAARLTNAAQTVRICDELSRSLRRSLAGARITALGLTFKAATSDTRDSPALATCVHLRRRGANVVGYDPELTGIDTDTLTRAGVIAVDEPYRAAKAADAILVLTEWPQFTELDWRAIACEAPGAVVLDTRNVLTPARIAAAGLTYLGNGVPEGF